MANWQHNYVEFECTANDLLFFLRDCITYDCYPVVEKEYQLGEDGYKHYHMDDYYRCRTLTWNMLNMRSVYELFGTHFSYSYLIKDFDIRIEPVDNNLSDGSCMLFAEYDDGILRDAFYFVENTNKQYLYGDNKNNLKEKYKVHLYFNVRGYAPPYDIIVMMAQRVDFSFSWNTSNDGWEGSTTYYIEDHVLKSYEYDEAVLIEDENIDIDNIDPDDFSSTYQVDNGFDDWFTIVTPLEHFAALEFSKAEYERVNGLLLKDGD